MKTFLLHNGHLGDCWCYINYLLNENKDSEIKCVSPNLDRVNFYKSIYDLLETDVKIIFEQSNTYDVSHGKKGYLAHCQYKNTKIKYSKGSHIAYSFDASYMIKEKIPENINEFLQFEEIKNIPKIRCGLPMSLEDNVKILSNCIFYIGVDNGISHVARSVGCPMLLIEHRWDLEKAFPSNHCVYKKCNGIENTKKIILHNL